MYIKKKLNTKIVHDYQKISISSNVNSVCAALMKTRV